MKAAAITPGKRDSLRIVDVPAPRPGHWEVAVAPLEAGVCGTDLELNAGFIGEAPPGSDFLIIGHENLGVVERLGSGVDCLTRGDLVVATVRRPCPERCYACRNGGPDDCLSGDYSERGIRRLHGYMADRYVESPDYLVQVPPELRPVAVLLEPLSVVEKGIEEIFKIQERLVWQPEKALVAGTGPIGLLATFVLEGLGVDTVAFATRERGSLKARVTEACGARYVDVKEEPLEEIVSRYGPFDISIEATGVSQIAFDLVRLARTDGVVCLTGLSPRHGETTVCTDCVNMDLVMHNKAVFGTSSSNRGHFERGIARLRSIRRQWPGLLERLFTKRVGLDQAAESLCHGKDDIKVVVEIGAR